jgi:hypothetical protein
MPPAPLVIPPLLVMPAALSMPPAPLETPPLPAPALAAPPELGAPPMPAPALCAAAGLVHTPRATTNEQPANVRAKERETETVGKAEEGIGAPL